MATFIGLDDNPTYIEDGVRVVLDDDATVIGAVTYNGTNLTLARDGGASPADVFGGSGTLSLDEGQVLLQETVDNEAIFISVGSYTNAGGTLVIAFNANATQARVDAVLEQITYANQSDGPPPFVIIDLTFDDGVAPATGSVRVNITGVNDAPELGLVAPVAAYRPGSTAVVLSSGVTVEDRDSTTLISAKVQIANRPDDLGNPDTTTDTPDDDDVLSADPGGSGIAVSYNPTTHVLTLSGTATLEQYRQVLGTVAYRSTDADPSQGGASSTRTIEWQLDDGSTGNNLSAVQTTTLHFTPSLDLDGSAVGDDFATGYTENGPAAPVADWDAVVSNGGASLTFATLTLTNARAGDTLSIVNPLPGGITGSVDASLPGQITVSLTGSASPASYQTALSKVVFASTSENPDVTLRDVTVVVGDDVKTSNAAHATIAITALNDAPTAQDGAASGNEDIAITGSLSAGDVDSFSLTYSRVANATNGTVTVSGNGTFSYTPNANFSGGDSFTFKVNDGQLDSNIATFSLTVAAVNDAPTASGPVTLAAIDEDSAPRLITQAELLANASDVDGPPLLAANLAIATGLGSLANNSDGTWSYTPAPNDDTAVTFSYQVTDGTTPVAASASLDINPMPDAPTPHTGTTGDDSFAAPAGSHRFDGLAGIDTMTFGFRLVDATVTYVGNQVIIDSASSHTVLTGFETYVFTDGTVNNNDGSWLIDDLFYYSQYHDVWTAHVEADTHFNTYGWHEDRNPNAFFNTALYLSLYQDVKNAGVNPLNHFDTSGWIAHRIPSFNFDPDRYLADNPDVAAAHIDPLEHFLHFGAQEGRQPTAPTGLIAANGFDSLFYLKNNPDVLAAHINPLEHFNTEGWHERRNPNALFDTDGYLATYTDVAAAGVNPLDHYHAFGWQEGRDPSVGFDTTSYLAAYSDVAAAHIDPAKHFLEFGLHEGRSPFADGPWG